MPPALKRVLKRLNGSWDLPILALGKWHLKHWGWDLATGTGKKKKRIMGMGEMSQPTNHLKLLLSPLMHNRVTK